MSLWIPLRGWTNEPIKISKILLVGIGGREVKHPNNWRIQELGALVEFASGGTPSKNDPSCWDGDLPWISASTMHTDYITTSDLNVNRNSALGVKIAHPGSLLILVRGSMLWKKIPVCIVVVEVAFNQDVKSMKIIGSITSQYLLYWFLANQRFLLNKIVGTGIGAGKIEYSDLITLPILVPEIKEQKTIAELLSTWDRAIEKTEKLIEAKEKKVAHLSSKYFSKAGIISRKWSTVPLRTVFKEVKRLVGNKKLVPYSISAGKGFVSQAEKFGKDISGDQYSKYTHLISREFVYNKGNSLKYPQGCIYLYTGDDICVPNVYICFSQRDETTKIDFYKHYFLNKRHSQELKKHISSGARGDGLLNVNTDDFFKIQVPYPSQNDQELVALEFSFLENEILALKKKKELYQFQKQGLMQKLLTGKWRVKIKGSSKGETPC